MQVINKITMFVGYSLVGLLAGGVFIAFFAWLFSHTQFDLDHIRFFIYLEIFGGVILLAGGLFRGINKGTMGAFACSGLGLGMVFVGWFANSISHLRM